MFLFPFPSKLLTEGPLILNSSEFSYSQFSITWTVFHFTYFILALFTRKDLLLCTSDWINCFQWILQYFPDSTLCLLAMLT